MSALRIYAMPAARNQGEEKKNQVTRFFFILKVYRHFRIIFIFPIGINNYTQNRVIGFSKLNFFFVIF